MSQGSETRRIFPGWLIALGGVPLLVGMLIEFITVLGRNTGVAVFGSIELVQAAILLSSSTAIVIATLARAHAKVRVLLHRPNGAPRTSLKLFNALCGSAFFLSLSLGSAWIMLDMWGAHEQSELLGIPYLPLRGFAASCMLVTAVLYALRIIAGLRK